MEADVLPTCYRHGDRETRLACSQCDRPICLECVRRAPVGQKCPECAAPAPGAAADLRRRASAPFSMAVLGIAVGVFLAGLLIPSFGQEARVFGVQANELVARGQWYRVLTATLLHADSFHILFNMWALYLFGPQLERQVGTVPFASLYLASAVGGGAAFFFLAPQGQALGASGAIFGLFGAWLAAFYRTRHTLVGKAGLRQLLVLLGINLALPLFVPRIAWQAHLGGLIVGGLLVLLWTAGPFRSRPDLRTAAATVVAVAGIVAVALA